MEMIDDSSYITSHRVWRSDIFQSHIGMQTERILCDPSNWSDLLKTPFSNYNLSLCSWLLAGNNIFIVFWSECERERLGDFLSRILPTIAACQVITEEMIFPIRDLSLVQLCWGSEASVFSVGCPDENLSDTNILALSCWREHQSISVRNSVWLWRDVSLGELCWHLSLCVTECHWVSCRSREDQENITTFFFSCWDLGYHTQSHILSHLCHRINIINNINNKQMVIKWIFSSLPIEQ